MKSSKLIRFIVWAVPVSALCVFAYMMVANTKPREVKDCIVTINVVEAESNKGGSDEVQISKSALENTLRQSAYAARQEAQNEYDKNFSILLTILTIFGIAWPLVVAFAQYKFNERELDKIQTAEKNASEALVNAKDASDSANKASARATEASNNANKASSDATQALTNATSASADATQALANATTATANATDALSKANEASANANKALKEVKETDLLAKRTIDFIQYSDSTSWHMLCLIYAANISKMKKLGEDKTLPSMFNFNKLMAAYCKCLRTKFGHAGKWSQEDVPGLENAIFSVVPEDHADKISDINKFIIKSIIGEIYDCVEDTKELPIKLRLEKILNKANTILEAYNHLVPNGTESDLKA